MIAAAVAAASSRCEAEIPPKNDCCSSGRASANIAGVPAALFPVYLSLALDAVAVGVLVPVLPFHIQSLGATSVQLSSIISATYASQAVGCLLMGRLSDRLGRRAALQIGLSLSAAALLALASASTLRGVLLARVLAGCSGGLMPIVQACVLDAAGGGDSGDSGGLSGEEPRLLGMIQAAFCAGFTLGPVLSLLLAKVSARVKIRISAIFPLIGLAIVSMLFRDTGKSITLVNDSSHTALGPGSEARSGRAAPKLTSLTPLFIAGFSAMFAFATEGLYPILLKQAFGLAEGALASIAVGSSMSVLLLQTLLVPLLFSKFGKFNIMFLGNALLSSGLLGVALIRSYSLLPLHVLMVLLQVVGFSLADTALVSLISEHSASGARGRHLSTHQAAQAVSRIASPLLSGYVYANYGNVLGLPTGSLAFIINAATPALASAAVYYWLLVAKL
jgi:DHA1 family tetracycline resistance protein-like MFS transporter